MPCAYEIDSTRRLVYCRCLAPLTAIDLLKWRDALQRDQRFHSTFSLVHEMEAAVGDVSAHVVHELRMTSPFLKVTPRAFVAAEPNHFGVARTFQVQRELSGDISDARVCRSLEEALDWLGVTGYQPTNLTKVV